MVVVKKPKLADILGTKLTKFQIVKGEMNKLDDGSDMAKLWVKGIDEEEESIYDNLYTYGFVSPTAIESVEKNSSFSADEESVEIELPFPKENRTDINWVKNPF